NSARRASNQATTMSAVPASQAARHHGPRGWAQIRGRSDDRSLCGSAPPRYAATASNRAPANPTERDNTPPMVAPLSTSFGGEWPRRRGAAVAAAGLIVAASLYGLGPGSAAASSHREAPLTAADPSIDNTDFYAFVSPDKPDTVTFVSNWIPFEEPNGGPNF